MGINEFKSKLILLGYTADKGNVVIAYKHKTLNSLLILEDEVVSVNGYWLSNRNLDYIFETIIINNNKQYKNSED